MDKEQFSSIIEKLKTTARCRPEVKETSEHLREIVPGDFEELIRYLLERGEDRAMGILLNVCAVNNIRLAPDLLALTLTVVEPITDFAAPYRNQDQTAIQSLLAMAETPNISWQRMIFAARLATELTIRFNQDAKPVKKVLMKLSKLPMPFETGFFNTESLALLNLEEIPDDTPWLTRSDPLETLPERKPPVVIGGDYTVRRPVPKLGRNEPCHCGSGKKYKKCCLEKDQALIRDASPHEGVTMTELRTNPGMIDDPDIIDEMRAYDLKKLNPRDLTSSQLLGAYRRADTFGLYDLALAMLVELQGRSDFELDPGHFQDLMDSALSAKDMEAARRIKAHVPEDQLYDAEDTEFRFALLENPTWLNKLESRCRAALTGAHEPWQAPLISISYMFEKLYPALSMIFARTAIMEAGESPIDQQSLLDVIHNARIELDLNPWEDPMEDFLDWLTEKNENEIENDALAKEIENLKVKVTETKQLATQRQRDLRIKEQELAELNTRLLKKEETQVLPQRQSKDVPKTSESDRQMISRLRQRIDRLKQDISNGQQERRDLRKQIQQAMTKAEDEKSEKADNRNPADTFTQPIPIEDSPLTILFPEFTPDFRNSTKSINRSIVAKALKAATGFSTQDRLIWRQTKALTALQSIYSIRVGIHHRLLIRWEKDVRLQVLDLIPRQELETWIKGFRKKA